jgi:F0F1-type ATP synthase membrane subunit a
MGELGRHGRLADPPGRARASFSIDSRWRGKMRAGEISFYLIAAMLALAVAVLPRSSLLAAALFVAIAAFVFVIAFEG